MPTRLLFVCSGNICRSPMAEGIARIYAALRGRDVEVASAGTLGLVDHPAEPKAVAVCREIDVDISSHRSQGLSPELVAWAHWILVMEYHHSTHLAEHYPKSEDKRVLLGNYGGIGEIADPMGGWRFRFRRSREQIRRSAEGFIDRLPHDG